VRTLHPTNIEGCTLLVISSICNWRKRCDVVTKDPMTYNNFTFNIINFSSLVMGWKHIQGCIQKFLDWPPGAIIASGTALCHKVQLYRYFVSQSSEFCWHNPLCCVSTSVYCCKPIFRYRLSPETFGYTSYISRETKMLM